MWQALFLQFLLAVEAARILIKKIKSQKHLEYVPFYIGAQPLL